MCTWVKDGDDPPNSIFYPLTKWSLCNDFMEEAKKQLAVEFQQVQRKYKYKYDNAWNSQLQA